MSLQENFTIPTITLDDVDLTNYDHVVSAGKTKEKKTKTYIHALDKLSFEKNHYLHARLLLCKKVSKTGAGFGVFLL